MSDELEVKEPVVVDSPLPSDGPAATAAAEASTEIVDPGGNQEWDLGAEFPDKSGESGSDKKPAPGQGAPADDGFDAELLGYAEQFGFAKDDFSTPLQLTKALASMHRILAKSGGQAQNQPAQRTPTVSAPPVAAPAPKPAPVTPPGDVAFEFKVPELLLDPDRYDAEVVAFARAVKAQHEHNQGKFSEVAQLRGLVGELLHGNAQQQAERYYDEVDSLFATDETMADTFGNGNRFELLDGPQLAARRTLIEQMDIARGVFAQQGKPAPSTQKLYAIAKSVLHSDKTQQIARRQIADKLRNTKGQFTAPPVHKGKGELPPGRDRAVAAVAQHMKETGIFDTDVDTGLE